MKQVDRAVGRAAGRVAPHAGAWIETIIAIAAYAFHLRVAPHAGAWIETSDSLYSRDKNVLSRPTRARGLKPDFIDGCDKSSGVAPHAGAWIETIVVLQGNFSFPVAPHAGAWIETP